VGADVERESARSWAPAQDVGPPPEARERPLVGADVERESAGSWGRTWSARAPARGCRTWSASALARGRRR